MPEFVHHSPTTLSIIIVNFNTAKLTLGSIRSIYEHAPQCSFEIIVVDNGSEESLESMLEQEFPEVKLVNMGYNRGFSVANNLGIHNSKGRFLLLLNSDTQILNSSLQKMVDHLEEHSEVGAIGPRQVDSEDRFTPSCGHFPTIMSEMVRKIVHYQITVNNYLIRDYLDDWHAQRPAVDWVSGSCMMIRREALQKTGLLDEQFFMYFEDIDLCTRIRKAGWSIQYLSTANIRHFGGASAKHNLMRVLTEYRKSQIYFAWKYYGAFGAIMIQAHLFVKYLVYLIPWSLIWGFRRMIQMDFKHAYNMALLSKKVLQISLQGCSQRSIEPRLAEFPKRAIAEKKMA